MDIKTDFIVIDTEGKPTLTEIAIINSQGQTIYEACVIDNSLPPDNTKSLSTIITDIAPLMAEKTLVCHHIEHDLDVLKASFEQTQNPWQPCNPLCTYELARQLYPNLTSYSLEYLAQYFDLKVENRGFNANLAHRAKYDALFTYHLYCYLNGQQMYNQYIGKPNPFGNSRVDTPFQNFPDVSSIYADEFTILQKTLEEVKHDANHQSKGVVIIGEAGNGKTHLMMRLAKERLISNRLLFIRQPNHPDAILYHVYSRMLESLTEKLPGSQYSQLEDLLAKSFSNIQIENLKNKPTLTQREENILARLSENPLNLYSLLGAEGTEVKRKSWDYITKMILNWWSQHYSLSGYPQVIIRGLIKYCRYSDHHKRELVRRWLAGEDLEPETLQQVDLLPWGEDFGREDFSLEAMKIFSQLSFEDEPLIIIFDQLEGLKYQEVLLRKFGEAIKEMFTHIGHSLFIFNLFPDRWQHFQQFFDSSVIQRMAQYRLSLHKPSKQALEQVLTAKAQSMGMALALLFTETELEDILNQQTIRHVLTRASDYYRYKIENVPLPQNTISFEQEMRQEIDKLKTDLEQIKSKLGIVNQAVPANQPAALPTPATSTHSNHAKEDEIQAYFKNTKAQLESNYDTKREIISDTDDRGKLVTILQTIKLYKSLEIDYLRLGKRKLPEHVLVKTSSQQFVVGFLHVSITSFTPRIKNFNELVVNHPHIRFLLLRDEREAEIKGKSATMEIEKLNDATNGTYFLLNKWLRVEFELIHKVISDLQNKDLDFNEQLTLETLENFLKKEGHEHWLFRNLK